MVAVSASHLVLLAVACASTASLASAAPSPLAAVTVPRSDSAVLSAPADADQTSASSTKASKRVKGRKSKKSKSKKGGKGKGDKKKKHYDHDVVSKAANGRVHRRSSTPEPRHHRHHHHHHDDGRHHHHDDDDKVIVNGDHDHVHVHRRQSSVVIPGENEEDEQTYVVHSERDVSDPEGSIQVVTSDQKKMGDLWYDDSKDTMFVSSINHTTFQLHCAEDLMCQLVTLMYDEADAKVVERCMSYGGDEDGKMGFDECEEGGANQTFRYEEESGVVKPVMVNSMASGNGTTAVDPTPPQNGTTAASAMDTFEDDETLHDDEFMEESQLGARDDTAPPSGSTNVSLVFVPKYPNAPSAKAAPAGNDTSSTLQTEDDKEREKPSGAATYTVTETVTVSSGSESATGEASKTVMNAAAATTSTSDTFASVSESSSSPASSATASASMGDDWEVEVHQAADSVMPTTTPAPSSDASTPSSSADASSIASRIAAQNSDSTISAFSTPTPSSDANASQLKFRADRLW